MASYTYLGLVTVMPEDYEEPDVRLDVWGGTSGTVLERYLYSPYGKVTVLDSDFSSDADGESDYSNTTLYTGRTFDPAICLYDYRHRVYHRQLADERPRMTVTERVHSPLEGISQRAGLRPRERWSVLSNG